MMHPMRVEWTAPDEPKRAAAQLQVDRALSPGPGQDVALHRDLTLAHPWGKSAVLAARFPDLAAVVHHFGTLLSIRYISEQWGVVTSARGSGVPVLLSKSRWVALVATAEGTREMDPLNLRVMWPCAPGDPIGGVVTAEELARRVERGEP